MRISDSYAKNKFLFLIASLIFASAHGFSEAQKKQVQIDQERIRQVCHSSKPVLVVDKFLKPNVIEKYIDVDGDLLPDVAHGEIVESFLKISGKSVLRQKLEGSLSPSETYEVFKEILEDVKSGRLQISAINFSQIIPLSLAAFDKEIVAGTNSENIFDNRQAIMKKMIDGFKSAEITLYEDLNNVFAEFKNLEIPVVVAAGNQGEDYINFFSLLPGVISVGSLAIDKEPLLTSGNSSLVTVWRQGEYVVKRLADSSVDFNNDGKPEIAANLLSKQVSLVHRLRGKSVAGVLRTTPTDPDSNIYSRNTSEGLKILLNQLSAEHLYEIGDLNNYFHRGETPYGKASVLRAKYFDRSQNIGFTVDEQENIKFDPLGDGDPRQVLLLSGTSYAAPSICR